MQIYRFCLCPQESILAFSSPVGNNDVPYPYIVTPTRIYLMEAQVTVPRTGVIPHTTYENIIDIDKAQDPYRLYFTNKLIETPYKFEILHARVI